MPRRYYTFLIVAPHGKLRKVQVPFYALHLTIALSLVGMVTLAAMASSYARMLLKVSNYNDVRSAHEALKTQYRTLENVVSHTNAKLNSLESLAGEVALTYGFGGSKRPRFPEAVLALATQTDATLESSYSASLYAFELMKKTALNPPGDPIVHGFFSIPRPIYQPLSLSGLEAPSIPSMWPLRGQVTGGFGQRMDPLSGEGAYHWGLDIAAPRGTDVQAAADGAVAWTGRVVGYGNEILIDHGDNITTKYCHLGEIYVAVGEEVKQGEVIGTVGMTGKTTGPHLHYEVLVRQMPVNPSKYLRE